MSISLDQAYQIFMADRETSCADKTLIYYRENLTGFFTYVEGADKILDYYRASKGAFLCIQKNKRILHYGYIIKQSL